MAGQRNIGIESGENEGWGHIAEALSRGGEGLTGTVLW